MKQSSNKNTFLQQLSNLFPIIHALRGFSKTQMKGDLSAGLTVGVMLIPQGMAYAMLAGIPPIYGLYASTIPLIIYGLMGTSRQLAVGPVALMSLLTATGVELLVQSGTDRYIELAILLALMTGLILLVMGIFRLGFLVNFLSHPVISGFTSAAALIISLNQLKHLLGIDIPRSNHIHKIIGETIQHFDEVHLPTLAIGLSGIVLIAALKKWNKNIPGPLIAVIFGVSAVSLLSFDKEGVKIVGSIPKGIPDFAFPIVDLTSIKALIPAALTISFVGFMESIAVAKAMQSKHKNYEVSANQELKALGCANIGGAFFGSFPVTGGFSRTAVNDQAGAKTGLASIISALLIILTLLFLTPLFYYLPKAILASIIIAAVLGLIDMKEAKYLWHINRRDFSMLIVTFLATLTLGIEVGILTGVGLSLIVVIYQAAYPHYAVLGQLPGTTFYRNVKRFPDAIERDEVIVIRFDAQLFFGNLDFFRATLRTLEANKPRPVKAVIIVAEAITGIDSSAIHMIEDIVNDYKRRGIQLYMAAVVGPVRDAVKQTGLISLIGEENFFLNPDMAVSAYESRKSHGVRPNDRMQKYTLQSN